MKKRFGMWRKTLVVALGSLGIAGMVTATDDVGVPFTVIDTDGSDIRVVPYGNHIARDSSGALHVVYTVSADGWYVAANRSEDDGATWSGRVRVDSMSGSSSASSLAVDSNDVLHVGFTFNVGSFYTRSTNGGASWQAAVELHDGGWGDWDYFPQVVVDATNGLHAVYKTLFGWGLDHIPFNTVYKSSGDLGASWSARRDVTPYAQGSGIYGSRAPNLYLGRDGWRFVTYTLSQTAQGGTLPPRFMLVYFDGENWSAPIQVSGVDKTVQRGGDMAVDSTGRLHLAWSESDADDFALKYRIFDPSDLSFSPIETLSDPDEQVGQVTLGIYADDRVVIAYDIFSTSDSTTYRHGVYLRDSLDAFAVAYRVSTHPAAHSPSLRSMTSFLHQPDIVDLVWIEPQSSSSSLDLVYANVSDISAAPPVAPVADFEATPRDGQAPLEVHFSDLSTGDPAGWAWYFGDEQLDGDWQFVADAPWAGRDKFSAAFLPSGEIVVAGGYNNIGPSWMDNDVWRSNDGGATWIQLTSSAAWSARMGHQLLALSDGGVLLLGGNDGAFINDVWRSDDKGATWTRLTESAGWSTRGYFTVEELPDGSVVLIGGHNGITSLPDVWRSTDGGATWQEMTPAAEFGPRSSHASAVLPDGALLLIGGQIPDQPWYQNDVWRSDDAGATWVQVTASAAWSARVNHAAVALPDGSVLLLGGYEGTSVNDVWRSNDGGATWSLLEGTVGWSTRMQFAAGVQPDGAVILLGGNDGTASSPKRDVWKLDTAGSYDQHPTHVYEHPGAYTVTLQVFNENGKDRLIRNQYIRVGMRPSDGEIVEARRPLFAWPDVEGATSYQIWIQRNGQKHLSTWVEGENSWTPGSDLAGGSYQWWIRSWGAEIGMGAWSTVNDFTVPFAPPGDASPQSPQGAQALGERRPEFSWTAADPAATWFQIWVNRNGRTHLTQWVEGTTPWTPPDDLPAGNYEWWVRGWNVDGYGAWSDPAASFSIPAMQPGALAQILPQGPQLARHLTYHWDKDARATWYRLWVGSVGAGTLHDQWHALAGEGVAVVDPGGLGPEVARPVPVAPEGAIADTQPTFRWAGGEYTWWVRGWGPDGSGPWTGPMAFSMPYAPDTWTRVYVNRGAVTALDDWTQDGELHSPMALQSGDHSWWLGVWDANAGRTIWSDRMDFTIQ